MLESFIKERTEKIAEMEKFVDKILKCDIEIKKKICSWLSVKNDGKYYPMATNLFLSILTNNLSFRKSQLFIKDDDSLSFTIEDIKEKCILFGYRYIILNDDTIYFPYESALIRPFDKIETEMLDHIYSNLKDIIREHERQKNVRLAQYENSLFFAKR